MKISNDIYNLKNELINNTHDFSYLKFILEKANFKPVYRINYSKKNLDYIFKNEELAILIECKKNPSLPFFNIINVKFDDSINKLINLSTIPKTKIGEFI